jgi:hypothetical protein
MLMNMGIITFISVVSSIHHNQKVHNCCLSLKPGLILIRLELVFLLLWVFSIFNTFAQSDKPCSKPKLYVRVAYNEVIERQLYDDYRDYKNIETSFLDEISSYVIREIRARAGDIEIIPLEQRVFIEDKPETPEEENMFNEHPAGEYHLDFNLGLVTTRNKETDIRDESLHPSYWPIAKIGDADIDGRIVALESYEYPDLYGSINHVISALCPGSLRSVIDRYEGTYFNALRDGRMELEVLSPGFVSPEPGEQKVRIRVKTSDCKGNFGEGTNLWFFAETDKGYFRPVVTKCPFQMYIGKFWWAKTMKNGEVEIEYQLRRGDAAFRESINVDVAGRGQKRIRNVEFFTAKTLRIDVNPEKSRVAPGEETNITVRLVKVDDKGVEEPVKGRTLNLKITGLNDGKINPQNQVTTDENGVGRLTYTAGENDKSVHIEASYKPQDYETTFHGSADLNAGAYTTTVDLDFSSPYIPDGRMSIAKLQMHVVFDEVFIESGSTDPLTSGFGDIDASEGRGTFTKFELNDVWTHDDPITDREHPKWIKKPPDSFEATLTMPIDDELLQQIAQSGQTQQKVSPPAKARLVFFTQMGSMPIHWGASTGSSSLEDFKIEFDVPWQDLLAGKPVTITLSYEEEDQDVKGTWTIAFKPTMK